MYSSTSQFFGLKNKLKQILDYILLGKENPIIIQGPMGVGKSRLLQELRISLTKINLRENGNKQYHFFDISHDKVLDRQRFAKEILDGMMRSAQNKHGKLPPDLSSFEFGPESTDQSFLGHLDKFRKRFPNDNFIIIIDSFHLVTDSNEFHAITYREIISLMKIIKTYCSSFTEQFMVRFVLAMQWRAPYLDMAGLKPAYVTIGPLEKEDFHQMCQGLDGNSNLSKTDLDWLHNYTKGITFFATFILANMPDHETTGSLASKVRKIAKHLSESDDFNNWFRCLREDEKYILWWITNSGGVISETALKGLNTARGRAFFDLKALGFVEQKSEGYTIGNPCVKEFLGYWNPYQFVFDEFQPVQLDDENMKHRQGIVIYEASQRVYIEGRLFSHIPHKEYRAFVCLCKKPNLWIDTIKTLIPYVYELTESNEDIDKFYEETDKFYGGSITQVIARLRKILGTCGDLIKTKSGFGYGIFNTEIKIISDQ